MATKTAQKAAKTNAAEVDTNVNEIAEDAGANEPAEKVVPKEVDPTSYVVVRNGFHGKLVYKSSRTGETFRWSEYGDEQEMELRELKNAKNSNKKFFVNNWFMFDEAWIIDYLGVRQFYKNAVRIKDYDKIFDKPTDEMCRVLNEMNKSQKRSASYRAVELIKDGSLDSLKKINAIENALGIELIEK